MVGHAYFEPRAGFFFESESWSEVYVQLRLELTSAHPARMQTPLLALYDFRQSTSRRVSPDFQMILWRARPADKLPASVWTVL